MIAAKMFADQIEYQKIAEGFLLSNFQPKFINHLPVGVANTLN